MAIAFFRNGMYYVLLFSIAFEGVFGYDKIGGISIPRLIQFVFFLLIFNSFLKNLDNKILRLVYKILLYFTCLLILKLVTVTFIHHDLEPQFFSSLFRIFSLIVFLYIVYFLLSKNINYLNTILFLNASIMILAFFQSSITPFTNWSWEFKYDYFGSNMVGHPDSISFRQRVCGLYSSSIPLAYILTTNMILGLYMHIKTNRNIYILYFVFIGIIAFFSLTRSAVLSWAILFLYLVIKTFLRSDILLVKKLILSFVIFGFVVYGINIFTKNADTLDRVTQVDGKSAQGRMPLAITGLYASIKYPLGISRKKYDVAKSEMYNVFNNYNVLIFGSHNGLVNIGIQYTAFGFMVIGLFAFSIKNFIKNSVISKELKLFFAIASIAYLGNSLFHNKFLFIDDFYSMIIFAVIAIEFSNSSQKEDYGQD